MNFSEKLKSKRKEFGMSQEQLAEKLNVSRQAITKWETDGGLPDIENILSIASLFNITVDDLLSSEKQMKSRSDFFYNSTIEYDVDSKKHLDINIGGAYEITVIGNDSEKLRVQLASNTIESIEQLLKVKLDDGKNNIDVDIHRDDKLSEAQLKESLYVVISVPLKYIVGIEVSGHAHSLLINNITTESISFDGRVNYVQTRDVLGLVELDCSTDMTVVCSNLSGGVAFNQISATSILHLPKGTEYQVKIKGPTNRVSYSLDGIETNAPSYPDAANIIKVSGLNMELVVNELTDIFSVMR